MDKAVRLIVIDPAGFASGRSGGGLRSGEPWWWQVFAPAARAGDQAELRQLGQVHHDRLAAHPGGWSRVPAVIRDNPAAVERFDQVVRAVEATLPDRSGQPRSPHPNTVTAAVPPAEHRGPESAAPETVGDLPWWWREFSQAVDTSDDTELRRLCGHHQDRIAANLGEWEVVPPRMRLAERATQRFADVVLTVAQTLAELGRPELRDRVKDVKWQRQ